MLIFIFGLSSDCERAICTWRLCLGPPQGLDFTDWTLEWLIWPALRDVIENTNTHKQSQIYCVVGLHLMVQLSVISEWMGDIVLWTLSATWLCGHSSWDRLLGPLSNIFTVSNLFQSILPILFLQMYFFAVLRSCGYDFWLSYKVYFPQWNRICGNRLIKKIKKSHVCCGKIRQHVQFLM